jgi:YVTN family beta-propeller protein
LNNDVAVIDGATNAIITTIPVGSRPYALVHNPTDNKIYCASEYGGTITVIDCTINAVITTLPVGGYPYALLYNLTNNKVYCVNTLNNDVAVIDGATNAIITTIPVGHEPCALTWNSVQNRVYAANHHSSSISVIRDVTGIEEDQNRNLARLLQIYPNPAKTFFIIHSPAPIRGIKIYDVLGKLIKVEDQTEFTNEKQISLKGISPGVYFLKVNTEDTEFIKKLIVTK